MITLGKQPIRLMRPMRNTVLALALLLAGCQVIPEDQQLLPLPNAQPVSNALLIEFTGFLCVNCPTAAEEARHLHEAYPDNLVVVAMHPADNLFKVAVNGMPYILI